MSWPPEIVEKVEECVIVAMDEAYGKGWAKTHIGVSGHAKKILDAIRDDVVLKSELREERGQNVHGGMSGNQHRFVTDWERVPNA